MSCCSVLPSRHRGIASHMRRPGGFGATDGMRDVTDCTTRFGSESPTSAGAELTRGDRRHSCTGAALVPASWSHCRRATGLPRIIARRVGRVTRSEPPNASSIATKRDSRNPPLQTHAPVAPSTYQEAGGSPSPCAHSIYDSAHPLIRVPSRPACATGPPVAAPGPGYDRSPRADRRATVQAPATAPPREAR